ncbi:MAG: hypothetical protein IMZ65_01245 [Planctomycetes bacterium]|nr:hypothetical protein [Planctomycetota bacterium]
MPALKKIDPSITILACGSGQLGHMWGEGDTTVIRECADLIDYLSVHHYEDAAKYADGPAAAETFWRSLGERIAASKNPKVKLYVSEWNAQSTDRRTGLYAGGCLNTFERTSDVIGLAGPAAPAPSPPAPFRNEGFPDWTQPEVRAAYGEALRTVRGRLGQTYPLHIGGRAGRSTCCTSWTPAS